MTIRYYINQELNIALIICEGITSAKEYFKVVEEITHDKRYKHGMARIADLFSSTEDVELSDLKYAIEYNEQIISKGFDLDQTILLSRSMGIDQLVKTMKVLSVNIPLKLDVFHSLDNAIELLGLSDKRKEVIEFYSQCKYERK